MLVCTRILQNRSRVIENVHCSVTEHLIETCFERALRMADDIFIVSAVRTPIGKVNLLSSFFSFPLSIYHSFTQNSLYYWNSCYFQENFAMVAYRIFEPPNQVVQQFEKLSNEQTFLPKMCPKLLWDRYYYSNQMKFRKEWEYGKIILLRSCTFFV